MATALVIANSCAIPNPALNVTITGSGPVSGVTVVVTRPDGSTITKLSDSNGNANFASTDLLSVGPFTVSFFLCGNSVNSVSGSGNGSIASTSPIPPNPLGALTTVQTSVLNGPFNLAVSMPSQVTNLLPFKAPPQAIVYLPNRRPLTTEWCTETFTTGTPPPFPNNVFNESFSS